MFYGPHSTEAKRRISQSLIGNKHAVGNTSRRGKPGLVNQENPAWKGENASYTAKHLWIKRKHGKPIKCDFDDSHKARVFHWANISGMFKRDINDWLQLCPKCHRKLDGITGMKRTEEFKQKVSIGLNRAYAEGRR